MKVYLGVTIYFMAVILAACSILSKKPIVVKKAPEYVGIDSEFRQYEDEFFILSIEKDITYTKNVSMGFADINNGRVIGTCTFGDNFREIDIDRKFYKNASSNQRKALVFHELVHCYCERGHDFGKDQNYPEGIMAIFDFRFFQNVSPYLSKAADGYFDDSCPTSLMHPEIPSDYCLFNHFEQYQQEMLERCIPW